MRSTSLAGDVWHRVVTGDLFFMAGAITFNVLVAFVPLLLLVVGLSGFALELRIGGSPSEVVRVLMGYLPAIEGEIALAEPISLVLEGLIAERAGFSLVGALALLWISTRLVSTLRTVLRDVFQLERERGIIRGKLFDLWVVMAGGLLLLLNVGITVGVRALRAMDAEAVGADLFLWGILRSGVGLILSLAAAWVLFFLLYWHLPARRIPFRTAAVGASFTAFVYEVLKGGFAWYATSFANYSNAYGSMAVAAVLFFWIYYGAAVFILGGYVARSYEVRRKALMSSIAAATLPAPTPGRRPSPHKQGGAALLFLAILAAPCGASAQGFAPFGGVSQSSGFLNGGEGVVLAAHALDRNLTLDSPLVEHDGAYIVVHIAENRVFVIEGTEVVWSAAAGTGTGFQLEGQGREWDFSTPVGLFRVLRKEKDPVWIAPDWWYVEQGMRIPTSDASRARIAGTLGTSALFLGDGIAIHGTDRPELLINFPDPDARRLSHGCIRLTNEAARELFHRVEVGTPVLIY